MQGYIIIDTIGFSYIRFIKKLKYIVHIACQHKKTKNK